MNDSRTTTLGRWLAEHYRFGAHPSVSLLRSYTNDVYLVVNSDARFVLKVYGAGWRRDVDIRYEIDLLRHLDAQGVAVAMPIAGIDGDVLQHLELDGRPRQAVVFAYADGVKPEPPFTTAMYRRQGLATAVLHQAADSFRSDHQRQPMDRDYLIDRPLTLIERLDIDEADRRAFVDTAELITTSITRLAAQGLDWGPCHGDLTFDNVHLTDEGTTIWYDFDSGGPGWRAVDLQGWAAALPDRHTDWLAFLDGYRDVRALSDNDIAAAPYLHLAQRLWGIRVDLERRVLAQGPARVRTWLADQRVQLIETARAVDTAR